MLLLLLTFEHALQGAWLWLLGYQVAVVQRWGVSIRRRLDRLNARVPS